MTRFEELVAKLSELFELDKADLDFGIHRIIKTKHAQIAAYLKERLPEKVRTVLGELAQAEAGESLAELKRQIIDSMGNAAFEADGTLAPLVANMPLGQKYKAAVEASRNARSGAQTEAEVYSHLYEFFSRYYEEGDFISRRRRTAGRETYAIPYDGEEVVLHWANRDQYYIKSSEDLKDYTFTVPLNPSGDKGRVQFKLTRMDAVQNNNKASRIFLLDSEAAIEATDDGLVIPFHFAEGKSRKQADEAAWEDSVLASLPPEWRSRLAARDAGYTGTGERNILQKHLRNYTKKNTSDYFIHKDLGGFLRRELDFYIKNEVMYLDDVDQRPADYLEKEVRKIRAIRAVAHDLIAFLAQFEDFQKRLWLKKKFVVETNWCVTLDRVPDELYGEIAANDAQREEWVRLFAIDQIEAKPRDLVTPAKPGYSEPLTVEFLKVNDKLVLDTAFFPAEFKTRLLASIDDIDAHLDGLIIHSENSQALGLIGERYRKGLQFIYTDPPYNTNEATFIYKNGYKHSSWLDMVGGSACLAWPMLRDNGTFCSAIDDLEQPHLSELLDAVFGMDKRLGTLVVEIKPSGRTNDNFLATSHEYVAFYGPDPTNTAIAFFELTEEQKAQYGEQDEESAFKWRDFLRTGGYSTPEERPNSYYPIYFVPQTGSISLESTEGAVEILPIDSEGKKRVWRKTPPSFQEHLSKSEIQIAKGRDGSYKVQIIDRIKTGMRPKSVWTGKRYDASSHGTKLLKAMFGNKDLFSFPKSLHAVRDCIYVALGDHQGGTILDYFAGSGTTGHAVINLNREDDESRSYILVEMGDYFDTVLRPRIQKVVYSADWSGGKPTTRDTGVSHCFKYIRLESYEDALNNLALEDRSADLLGLPEKVRDDYLLHYSLDVESRASLLDLARFENPFACTLKVYNRATGEAEPRPIDLPETFNYLLGLRVRTMQMRDGFLVIEGENPAAETILVIWRNVKTQDNAALEAFVTGTLRINPADTEYAAVYINGDTTLDDPHKKILLTEQVFHELMFSDLEF